jgi:hypothetical protein
MTEPTYPSDVLTVLKRRPVGKGAWKMTINELIESERTCLDHLRAIGNRHPGDAETQRYVTQAALESATRLIKLGELLHYKEGTCGQDGAQ